MSTRLDILEVIVAESARHSERHFEEVRLCANRCGKPAAVDRKLCPGCLATAAACQRRFAAKGRARRDKFRRDNGIVRDCGVWTFAK